MESSDNLQTLTPGELELIITSAIPSNIKSLGSAAWVEWHQRFQRLHQQAVWETISDQEEMTKDVIISNGKTPLLIHEAICISLWRQRVFPKILKLDKQIENTFLLYAILYHETVAVGLLELTVYDEDASQSISELVVDLIDYCIETITGLIDLVNSGYLKFEEKDTQKTDNDYEELRRQQKDLQFDIGMRCITIISCLANMLEKIHISGTGRLYDTHDTLLMMAELLQMEPWNRKDKDGKSQQYIEGRWKTVGDDDKLCRAETLAWLAVWKLMLNAEFNNYYDMNDFRKGQLCKLLYRITEDHMDQMPVLSELKRTLGQLSVADVTFGASKRKPVMIEVVPQIKPSILKIITKKEKTIAKMQLQEYFKPNVDELIELAKKLSVSYSSEMLEHIDNGGPKCALCEERAFKKCSRCKSDWYCGRECQVRDWSRHKTLCDKLMSTEGLEMKQ